MKQRLNYFFCAAILMLLAAGCSRQKRTDQQGIDWSVSLDRQQKTPYGASIAYDAVSTYFPAARKEPLSRGFRYSSIDEHMYGGYDSANLLVLLGLDNYVSNEEWNSLLKFVKAGNEVFVLSANIDVHLARSLHLYKLEGGYEEYPLSEFNDGKKSERALSLYPDTNGRFGYYGRSIRSYFRLHEQFYNDTTTEESGDVQNYERKRLEASIDTTPVILGNTHDKPDFIRYSVGSGHITLHAAPLVFSNYFLLQKDNRAYFDSIWHTFPANISVIYWNEYFKRDTTESSSMNVLLKYPATRWAFIIALVTLLLYVLFGLKRMQRIVPLVSKVENSSVTFVETVGRLYFNKGNHANLAEKMIQHFLEWVRSNYYLDTSLLNEEFVQQLAAKSGKTREEAAALVARIHDVRLGVAVTPEYLYDLHQAIQSFYTAR